MTTDSSPCAAALSGFHYHAFLSYSWKADYSSARKLEAFFESFHRRVSKEGRDVCPLSICRDGSDFMLSKAQRRAADMTVDDEVWAIIEAELKRSKYLVVLCSPDAVQSNFVSREVAWFLEHRGPEYILPVVTAGRDPARTPEECFPGPLLEHDVHRARIWYDLRGDTPGARARRTAPGAVGVRVAEDERVRLAADLLGWDNSTGGSLLAIWEREETRRRRRQALSVLVSVVMIAVLGAIAWTMRSNAVNENRIGRARELLLDAEAALHKDVQLSLLLVLEAARLGADQAEVQLPKLKPLLERVLLATPRQIGTRTEGVETFAWKPDGESIAIGYQDGVVEVVAARTGEQKLLLQGDAWVESIDWTSDGSLFAVAGRDTVLVIREGTSGAVVGKIPFRHDLMSVDWQAHTRTLAVGQAIGNKSRVVVFDYANNRRLLELPGMHGAWSPDGQRLATGGVADTLYVFAANGQMEAKSPISVRVTSIRWQPDGRRFAMASVDDVVIVWDIAPLRVFQRLPLEFPLSVAWSPSGKLLASGTGDDIASIWSTDTYERVFAVTSAQDLAGNPIQGTGPQGYVTQVAWSPDGQTFAAAGRDGRVLLYQSALFEARTLDDLLRVARAHTARQLTRTECTLYLRDTDCPSQ